MKTDTITARRFIKPYTRTAQSKARTSISIDSDILSWGRNYALRNKIDFSALVEDILIRERARISGGAVVYATRAVAIHDTQANA